MLNDIMGFLYFFAIGYGPYILLLLSIYFLLRAYMKDSAASALVSFLLFLPDVLFLLFLPLESILYILLFLPVLQVFLYWKIKSGGAYSRQEK